MELTTSIPTSTHLPDHSALTSIYVKFTTCLPENYQLSASSQRIEIPTNSTRYSLSEVMNQLLSLETPQVFDFLINKTFLRSSISALLVSQPEIFSAENTLEIEYTLAVTSIKSTPETEIDVKDWVTSINGEIQGILLSSGYEGVIRVWDRSTMEEVGRVAGHAPFLAINALKAFTIENRDYCISASKDRSVRVWRIGANRANIENLRVGTSHSQSVECLSLIPDMSSGVKFVSGSLDSTLRLWSLRLDDESSDKSLEHVEKKRKNEGSDATGVTRSLESSVTLEGHGDKVSGVCWADPLAVYSISWDRSMKQWDSMRGELVQSWGIGVGTNMGAGTCLEYSEASNLIATGHTDGVVRVWDPRVREGETSSFKLYKTFRSHKKWVTDVRFSPTNASQFVSCSMDGTIKLWDLRSATSLTTLPKTSATVSKTTCMDWSFHENAMTLVSGSDAGHIRTWTM